MKVRYGCGKGRRYKKGRMFLGVSTEPSTFICETCVHPMDDCVCGSGDRKYYSSTYYKCRSVKSFKRFVSKHGHKFQNNITFVLIFRGWEGDNTDYSVYIDNKRGYDEKENDM